jgi:protein phosphatase 1B
LGDFRFKQNHEKPAGEQALIAMPEVRAIERTNDDEILVIACDGIW